MKHCLKTSKAGWIADWMFESSFSFHVLRQPRMKLLAHLVVGCFLLFLLMTSLRRLFLPHQHAAPWTSQVLLAALLQTFVDNDL